MSATGDVCVTCWHAGPDAWGTCPGPEHETPRECAARTADGLVCQRPWLHTSRYHLAVRNLGDGKATMTRWVTER